MIHLKPPLVFKTNYSVSESSYRPIKNQGFFYVGSWITSESWDNILSCVNLNSKVSLFQRNLMTNYENCFLEATKKVYSSDKPYINENLRGLIHLQLNLFRLGKKKEALTLRKKIKKEIRRAASLYGKNKLNYLKQSKPKQWFKKLKEIGSRSCKNLDFLLDEPREQTANELNKH